MMLGVLACPNDMGADHGPVNRSPYPAALVQPPYSGPTAGQLARGFFSSCPARIFFSRMGLMTLLPPIWGRGFRVNAPYCLPVGPSPCLRAGGFSGGRA